MTNNKETTFLGTANSRYDKNDSLDIYHFSHAEPNILNLT
jgi:hypothetical protein